MLRFMGSQGVGQQNRYISHKNFINMSSQSVMYPFSFLSASVKTFHFHALEKEMATHSSVLAWRIPGMGEPVGLLSMMSHRVGHD